MFVPPLLALALLAACDQAGDARPEPTPAATLNPTDPYALETIALVAERMQLLRDLDGGDGPAVSLLDEAALTDLVDELFAEPEQREAFAHYQRLYTLLGLIDAETDLAEIYRELSIAGIAGLYRPELDRYYVRMFGQFSSLEESTSSHEYQHYLQDRHFDLEAMLEPAASNSDRARALHALVEGEATYFQSRYTEEYFNSVQLFGLTFGGVLAAAEAPAVPPALAREAQFTYLGGLRFVIASLDAGLTANELFARPPTSTEQVLHPEKYRANETGDDVSPLLPAVALPDGWSAAASDVLGELQLRTWLQDIGARSDAGEAAAGWGGDAYQLITTANGDDALLARIHWDTPADMNEFSSTVETALEADDRYQPVDCGSCAYPRWESPAGVLALWRTESDGHEATLLVIAPSRADVIKLMNLAR